MSYFFLHLYLICCLTHLLNCFHYLYCLPLELPFYLLKCIFLIIFCFFCNFIFLSSLYPYISYINCENSISSVLGGLTWLVHVSVTCNLMGVIPSCVWYSYAVILTSSEAILLALNGVFPWKTTFIVISLCFFS